MRDRLDHLTSPSSSGSQTSSAARLLRARGEVPVPLLRVSVDNSGPESVVRVSGEMDLSNSQLLHDAVPDESPVSRPDAIVDLTDLTFCDATGITALLAVRRRLEQGRRAVSVRGLQPPVVRLMRVAGVDGELDLDAPAVSA
ncbi:STAS domain-containing protein [Nocardioides mesophilus]|uniref:STAS domain-containing protein n=1 Tax=Nocardioides mesophilus TaxID=433659 RepID=A0A7G9R8H9_9ACTN|nr:STAS domain-containing protein [Nocardioides mesophilus]QNN51904.1 STAS domain-containing protein [Nocardioides mesophilus]